MKFKSLKAIGLLQMFVATVLAMFCGSCEETETMDTAAFALHYYSVTDIGPSMKYTLHPTYKGAEPSEFAITGITCDDETVMADNIVIDEENGDITFNPSATLPSGTYRISVGCEAGGSYYQFKDIIEVNMLLDTPEGVTMDPAEVVVKLDDENWWQASAQVTTEADKHVSIIGYAIAEDESKPYQKYFTVSSTGAVTFNPDEKVNIVPGEVYTVSLKLKTKAGEHIYPDAATFNIISKPVNLFYTPAEARVENGQPHESQVPTVNGSKGITYALKAVTPANSGFSIDAETGVIKLAEGATAQVGDVYTLDVTASNQYGSTDFAAAYQVTIVAFIKPIQPETFVYDIPETYEEKAYDIPLSSGFVGDEVIFSFADDNEQIIKDHIANGKITIDVVNGMVTIADDNTLAPGQYAIKVVATNPKGTEKTTIALDIKANPNKFTFHYGNNIDLTPAEKYADQFSFKSLKDMQKYDFTPVTTLGDRKATWKIVAKIGGTKYITGQGVTIDAETGKIDASTVTGFQTGQMKMGMLVVEATCGTGDLAYTVTSPVFLRTEITKNGVLLDYRPFALKINPRKGGESAVPTLTSPDNALFSMDYRRDFFYFDVDMDPTDALIEKPGLLNDVWTYFYQTYTNRQTANTGARKPVSAYDTGDAFNNPQNLDKTLLYIRPADQVMVVNKDVWRAADGTYASGVFIGGMTYMTDKVADPQGSANQFCPIAVWFDESFE